MKTAMKDLSNWREISGITDFFIFTRWFKQSSYSVELCFFSLVKSKQTEKEKPNTKPNRKPCLCPLSTTRHSLFWVSFPPLPLVKSFPATNLQCTHPQGHSPSSFLLSRIETLSPQTPHRGLCHGYPP